MAVKYGSDFRVWAFTLPASAFNARGMSTEFFAREIVENYGVYLTSQNRDLEWKTTDSHRYENGWGILIRKWSNVTTVGAAILKTGDGTVFD
jgi:hypothetical protein